MNRIKRNGYQKILSLTLSASLLLGLTGCGAQKAEETAATASEEEALLTWKRAHHLWQREQRSSTAAHPH